MGIAGGERESRHVEEGGDLRGPGIARHGDARGRVHIGDYSLIEPVIALGGAARNYFRAACIFVEGGEGEGESHDVRQRQTTWWREVRSQRGLS